VILTRRNRRPGRPFSRCPAGLGGLLPAVFLALFSATFAGAAGRVLHGHVPPVVRSLTPVDRLDPARHLGLVISLPLRNADALTNLLREIYDPASTNYHRYLTTDEFTEQFGPAPMDYQTVADFMTSNGFAITRTYANRVLLDVDAPVAVIERTFHINLRVFNHPTESRTFFAPDTDPALDVNIPVLDVDGLDNFVLPHPASLHLTPAGQPGKARPNVGTAPDGVSYIGSDFRKAYLPNVQLTGAGQVVGLFELDGYYPGDVAQYKSVANLPDVPLTNVLLDGVLGAAGQDNPEVALDIDMAISMAPGLSRVMVYEGLQPNDVLNQMAVDNQAKELSCSWAWSESAFTNIPPIDQIFMEFAAQGQSFFCASGDSGAYVGANTILTPSDDPNITIVGGTTLTTDQNVNYVSETVWNWFPGQAAASSGGVSPTYTIPSWQQGIDMTANLGSTNNRNLPDVALTADQIYLIADDGTVYQEGGTSAAAPLWAGLTALINQQAFAAGRSNVGFLNPALYAIGQGTNYLLNFHDITTGNDFNATSSPFYPATTGYDLCTGWGTPGGTNLINTLIPPLYAPRFLADGTSLAAENCLPTNGAIDPGETVTVNFQLQNIGTGATANLVATLLTNAGVSPSGGPQTYGIVGPNGAVASRPFTFTANGSCAGTITASLQLQDGPTNLGTVNFTLQLGAPVGGVTTFTQNFDGVTAPALPAGWTTVHSGSDQAWVTSTTSHDTSPNAAFAKESSHIGLSQLISPAIPITLPIAQLKFRHSFNTQGGFDGGILAIQIGNGPYQEILGAGGSFVTGGYTSITANYTGNPIGGLAAWTGNSGGFITTIVNLPASAAGQTIHLDWQFGTDELKSGSGWYVDTISILDGSYVCCSGSADMAVTQTASTNPAVVGQNLTYSLVITNLGSAVASGVTVTDVLPATVTFVSASPGASNIGGTVVAAPGTIANGAGTNFTITVKPTVTGAITNVVNVATTSSDSNPANNSSSLVTTVDAAPVITSGPSNVTVVAGATANFSVIATGLPAPAYQWFLNATNPVGVNSGVLTLSGVQPSQAGLYSVRVTNIFGSTNSAPALLTVDVPPAITAQPSNQVAAAGGTVSFTVAATGTPAPAYQWFRNATIPVGVNSNVLTLVGVQSSQAGAYTVVVTNLAGSTNSTPATLALLQSPDLLSITVTHTNVSVSFQSVIGLNYTLEYKNLLTDPAWTTLSPTTPGNGGLLMLFDTNTPPALRFYRVLCN
jgi:uncharacterized repeat protein (TIGR01451 family)